MRLSLVYILSGILSAGAISCTEEQTTVAHAEGDAFIETRYVITDGDTTIIYGLGLYTFGTSSHIGASAEGPDGTTYELVPFRGSEVQYFLETDLSRFSEELPPTGIYQFYIDVLNAGQEESLTNSDELTAETLPPMFISGHVYDNPDNDRMQIIWETLEGASYYTLEMTDTENNLIFKSPSIKDGSYFITAGATNVYWAEGHPATNITYNITLAACKNETASTGLSLILQARSVTTYPLVWGESGGETGDDDE